MLVFNTEMHVVTFIFVVLEIIMFFYQLITCPDRRIKVENGI